MTILTEEDRRFFDEQGYIVVSEVVPPENCNAVIDAMWEFLGLNRADLESCYREPLKPGGMIEMYQHSALWNNRQHPKLAATFAELLGTPQLAVSIDRVGMKLPRHPDHPDYDHKGFTHWDVDTSHLPVPFGVQAVLCLSDTDETMGGFQCVPGFHRELEAWIAAQPLDRNPHIPDLALLPAGMKVTPIPARTGDLIIWNSLLAHGNGHNISDRPRYSQYITMFPASQINEEARKHRIDCWQRRLPPGGRVFPGDPREIEQKYQETAELTPLGRKLLGLDHWE